MLDLEPRGPLPPEIYWRRRGLAIGVAVVVIAIVVAIIVAVLSGERGRQHSNNAAKKPTQNAQGANPEVKTQVEPPAAGEDAGQPPETPTAAVLPPPVLNAGDDCPDSTLAVKGLTNAPQYAIGDQPKFVMVVTNIGLVACKRDVGAAVLAAYVYSLDNKRLWSNLDCAPSNETLVKTFAPGRASHHRRHLDGYGVGSALPVAQAGDRAGDLQPCRAAGKPSLACRSVHHGPAATSGCRAAHAAARSVGTRSAARPGTCPRRLTPSQLRGSSSRPAL